MRNAAALARRGTPSAGVSAPGDKRFRRPDVRPAGRRHVGWWFWRAGSVLMAAVVVAGVGYGAYVLVLRSEFFVVNGLAVYGNARLSTGEVEALLQPLRGQHVFRVDLEVSRRRLIESPWIANATVRRVLPATIEVHVVERAPMAIARIADRLLLVDDSGVIVDEFGPQYRDFDLPVVDGLARASEPAPAVDAARAALTRRFLDALGPAGALGRQVSQVDVSNAHDVVVLLGNDPTLVHLGEESFLERLKRYQELAPTLADRLQEIDYVDMRFDERVYVKSKGQPKLQARVR